MNTLNIREFSDDFNMGRQYFVFDGQEVIKTGRIATREHDVSGWQGTKTKQETVCEITPIVQPGEYAWKKWVRESELFIINDTYAEDGIVGLEVDGMVRVEDNPEYNAVDKLLNQLRGKNDGPKA